MDFKNKEMIEKDSVKLPEVNHPLIEAKLYVRFVICAVIAFVVPFLFFISPKARVKKEIDRTSVSRRKEEAIAFSLSQQLSDSSSVILSFQNTQRSIEKQKAYLADVEERRKTRRTFVIDGCEFTMIKVNGGSFNMGSNQGGSDEAPVHRVTLSSYYIGETEVTQRLWNKVMRNNPSETVGWEYPVTNVTWYDCIRFVEILNKKYGLPFSLPTEAQWEFAARGGNKSKGYKYSGSNDCSSVANCVEYSFWGDLLGYSNTVGFVESYSPNELGVYDMSGNVKEWCFDNGNMYESYSQTDPIDLDVIDPYAPDEKAIRGGCYLDKKYECRSTYRVTMEAGTSSKFVGFRLVLNE